MAVEKVFISILVPILRGDIFEELTKFYAYRIGIQYFILDHL